ncbi:putative deoxyribonuclease [Buchnera aphidicola str. Bp (Baizongia pistaciae)]|uniref:Uncharacterized metal-dependent hydrolase bbp_325 n=1 Tax=Buchnera aphidicola subsp. Baizongia pistaciae (strain Bp) TaxID=224915 RepID=Y325_BUCBP|nr:YchF/TatD family DNA exonuclease [Buchnera aphidicola]Q89AG7.1 RecName: Full=Uncharacterized metal-dependent hydrolase bbp_325 [Buchnera aphidicola str. Bp (Baizongia pistaciae)]AAO27047.1 putative deoxyribonuclease [Buchnera aphidicola str. Bp (Baizongia pistaciae)]
MFLIDSHCHLDLLNYNKIHTGIQDVLNKSKKKHVNVILTVSTSIENFCYLLKFIKGNRNVLLSCGIHPHYIPENKNEILKLKKYSNNEKVVAIGETGLDYYRNNDNKKLQQILFREHIKTSITLKKPLLIHTRNSINDTINILKEENSKQCIGVLHSFTEDMHSARILLNMGFYISFSGIVTFKNSKIVHETAKFVPIDRILIETDSPYLSPVPYRGIENQPAYLYDTMLYIAQLKNMSPECFAIQTTKNFLKLFNLPSYFTNMS